MSHFTEDQVTQLAPDASSLKSGKELANERKWVSFARNERVLWGEVQGSGKDPYRTQIDLQHIAFKCSCPSRKFPCKHGLGLLFIFARNPDTIKHQADEPAWVADWMNKRETKAEAKVEKEISQEDAPKKLEKQLKDKEKRQNERQLKVEAGVAELELWLRDLVRTGFLSLPEKGNAFFEKTAARMVDAQATGLANLVRGFNKINFYQGANWHTEALALSADIYLLLESFKNLDKLPPLWQEDIKNRIGWNTSQKDLLAESNDSSIITDTWLVIGRQTETEEDITIQRNWLYGFTSGQYALILNFAYKNTPMPNLLIEGGFIEATLVFYQSNAPLRAIIKEQTNSSAVVDTVNRKGIYTYWEQMQEAFAQQLAANPWLNNVPYMVEKLTLVTNNSQWLLQDTEGGLMPLHRSFTDKQIWQLLALTGGNAVDLFLIKSDNTVLPLGIFKQPDHTYQLLK
ncbi:SWIM zinc finger family protein [Emticicia sp. 17c]|uniref:SWIM zinc finger family protein n=1 Tax=Emticicia sp. 17c TaxID=3127704 RepID=UPI00301C9462